MRNEREVMYDIERMLDRIEHAWLGGREIQDEDGIDEDVDAYGDMMLFAGP